ncbi:MAG: penicillin-binding protein 1C [Tannerella sp.]|jgi:penicillin-binding protein 1C|nr:penicillin-binding protein 1C [Tannerella sp.]
MKNEKLNFFLKHKRLRRRAIRRTIALLLVIYLFCLPRKLFDAPYATVVADRHGELLGARIAADGQWRFPPCDTVPEKFRHCIVAFEDRYFDYHFGVNPLAIVRAFKQNIAERRIVSGGSTLTMQTIRLSRGERRTIGEKVVEAILATRLECRYSKSEILAMYASHAPFGGNVIGLDAAAWRYFGHSSNQLSWAEAATLAVLPNAPSMIHLAKNRPVLLAKRNRLLRYLYKNGDIDEIDYDLAISENLPSEPLPLPQIAPHLVTYFYKQNEGKNIVSSLDKNIQLQVESILDRWHSSFVRSDIRNMAAIVIDVHTNEVAAYCGNVQFEDRKSSNQVDIIRAPRSTGSILKPFLYYIALQEGQLLPNTLLPDIPLNINGFVPQNFNMQYDGAVPASRAISRSLNIPSVYLLREYGVPKFHDFLKRAGITTLTKAPSHYGLSLILGGAEATLWDVSFIYSDMARTLQNMPRIKGSVVPLDFSSPAMSLSSANFSEESSIGRNASGRDASGGNASGRDASGGNASGRNASGGKVEYLPQIFSSGAVWQVFDAMKEVNRPEEIDWRFIPSMQKIAWKTGTSYGFRDAWAVGVTSRYVVGAWVGNANGEGKPELVGGRTAGPVMFDIFNILPPAPWFIRPESEFVEAMICRQSGHLKGRYCDEADTMPIVPNGMRTEACPYHTPVNMSVDGRFRAYENCIEAGRQIIRQNWFVLPPVWEWYYKQHHPDYKVLPPFMAGCGEDTHSPMAFIYPQSNAIVYLPKQLDGSDGEITFELAHSNSHTAIFWHIDSEYLGTTRDFHKYTFRPSRGKHSITVVDNEGNTLSVGITVE